MRRVAVLAVAIFGMTACSAQAVTKTWNGGTGDWTVGGNWTPTGEPGATDDVVISSGTTTLNADRTVRSLSISGGATRAGTGTLTVDDTVTPLSPATSAMGDDRYSGVGTTVFAAASHVTENGPCDIRLGATVRYLGVADWTGASCQRAGANMIDTGFLEVGSGGSLTLGGASDTVTNLAGILEVSLGDLVIGTGATYDLASTDLTGAATNGLQIDSSGHTDVLHLEGGVRSGSGTLTVDGPGTIDYVGLHGGRRDHEAFGDLGVARALGEQLQHVELATGEQMSLAEHD